MANSGVNLYDGESILARAIIPPGVHLVTTSFVVPIYITPGVGARIVFVITRTGGDCATYIIRWGQIAPPARGTASMKSSGAPQ